MAPLIVLIVSFLVFRAAGALGVRRLASSAVSLRLAVSLMFLFTAAAHFGSRRPDLVRMVPPSFPAPELLVTLTGLAEIAGALGLLVRRTRPLAATGLALLLVAMFPANVHAARAALEIGGTAVTPLVPRTILQIVFLAAVLVAGFGRGAPRPFPHARPEVP
jgi:uncharacterized membrane protein